MYNSIEYNRKFRIKKRREADKLFGVTCYFCHKSKRIMPFHKKTGSQHDTTCTAVLALRNPEEWVRLCTSCHKGVHWCMKFLNMTWDEITGC